MAQRNRCRVAQIALYHSPFRDFIVSLSFTIHPSFCLCLCLSGCICPGCLQLLEILEIYWNLKTLLEILEISWNSIGPPGNFCVRHRRSTALVSSHKNMDKYLSQKIRSISHQMCTFKFQMHQNPFSAGSPPRTPVGSLWCSPRFLFGWGGDIESWNTHTVGISALGVPSEGGRNKPSISTEHCCVVTIS